MTFRLTSTERVDGDKIGRVGKFVWQNPQLRKGLIRVLSRCWEVAWPGREITVGAGAFRLVRTRQWCDKE